MIGFVDQLNDVDTSGVEPLMHMSEVVNRLREDRAGGSIDRPRPWEKQRAPRTGISPYPK